jgi:hypothetical protein
LSGYPLWETLKEGRDMYFMNICTWKPEDEKRVLDMRTKWQWPEGVKVIFEFEDLQGGRAINVIDTDAKGLIESRSAWVHIVKFETFPVYPFGESKNLIPK